MAKTEEFQKMTVAERQNRFFNADFKRKKVSEIERNLVSIAEVSREYQVSRTCIYKWIYKYSIMRKKSERQVVEAKSDTKKIEQLQQHIKELEQKLGQKQFMVEYYQKMIELTEKDLGIDIKKKGSISPSDGSGSTGKNTSGK